LKVIAVIGSYGKTSTVNFIKTLLSFDYKVFTPGKSINTILGISQSINNNMDSNTEILLLEIGAYKVGEIKEVMKNFPSDISIITSFGTQHLERFKSTTNIIKAGIEVVDFAKKNAKIIAPKDIYNIPFEQYDIDIKFDENKEYITTSYKIDKIEGGVTYFKTNFSEDMFHTTLLGYSMISNLTLAIKTAELFNITNIQGKINIIKPTDRRMYPIYINDVLYIDDTYNIGEESAKSDINFIYDLKKKGIVKRIFVVTGGIVERGKESEKVNTEYGKFLSKIIDGVYIFNTPFKKYIKNGIKVLDKAVEIENYMDFEKYKKDFKKGDCILMQNEITDQYYFKS
jgi:UDP-N-acetylmuramoyl-tripeptide--D-alanyl-D-alanine ligase